MAGIGNHMQRSGRPGRVISVAAPEEGRAASKADAAFEEFVRARSAHLLRLALLLTGWNGAVAEDLTQTALERAYGRRRTLFGSDRAAEPYVRRVLVNAAIDWRRGLRRRAELPWTLRRGWLRQTWPTVSPTATCWFARSPQCRPGSGQCWC